MNRVITAIAVVTAYVAPAFADDQPVGAAPVAAPPATPSATPIATPVALSERSYNLPKGKVEVHGSLPIFGVAGESVVLIGVGASAGISDRLELGGNYATVLKPTADTIGLLSGHLKAQLVHNDKLSASLGIAAMYSHGAEAAAIAVGLAARYRFNKTLSLYTGTGGVPLCGTCLQFLGPVTGQLLIAFPTNESSASLAALTLPIGLGIQATPETYFFVDTSLATIELRQQEALLEFRDYIGLHTGLWHRASDAVELGLSLGTDLKNAGDFFLFELAAKVYL